MAYTKINFVHPHTGNRRIAPVGFSWTTFFFGVFPAIFRSDWKWALIQALLTFLTYGLSSLVFCFVYNRLYIKELANSGYKVSYIDDGTSVEDMSVIVGTKLEQSSI